MLSVFLQRLPEEQMGQRPFPPTLSKDCVRNTMFYFYLNNRETLSHSHVSARGTVTGVRRVTSEADSRRVAGSHILPSWWSVKILNGVCSYTLHGRLFQHPTYVSALLGKWRALSDRDLAIVSLSLHHQLPTSDSSESASVYV